MAASVSESAMEASVTGAHVEKRRGLVPFTEPLAEEVFAFQREAYPARRADWIEPRWRWMFQRSAARLAVAPMVWLYRGDGRVLAHQGAIPVRLHTRAGDCVTGWFVETMVLGSVRGKTIGPMLVAKAKQDLPFNLSLGQTEQMRELQYLLGWQRVAPLETLVFVLRGTRVLSAKLAAPLSTVTGAALTVWQRLRHWHGRRSLPSAVEVREVAKFGQTHDRLWARVEPKYPVAVVRDASYLNWRYVEQHPDSFIRLEIVSKDEALAVVVIRISDADQVYRYRRAWLTEIIVSPEHDDLVWATFEIVRQACIAHNADLVVFDVISQPLVRRALAFGFIRRKPSRVLLIATDAPPAAAARLALDGRNWLVTRGDSDIDRPW